MRTGIIGAGRIGGGIAQQLAGAGHEVMLSFSHDQAKLGVRARQIGPAVSAGSPARSTARS